MLKEEGEKEGEGEGWEKTPHVVRRSIHAEYLRKF